MSYQSTYAHTTLAQAVSQLQSRLQDLTGVYWAPTEVTYALVESLRIFQAITGIYRERAELPTTATDCFYNLNSLVTNLAQSVTDTRLVAELQYHLLEPSTGNSWTGSPQFTLTQVSNALQRVRNQFLFDTGCVVTRSTQPALPAPQSRIPLPDSMMYLRRVAWVDGSGAHTNLWRDDEFGIRSFQTGAGQNPDTPAVYSIFGVPATSIQISPPPINNGQLEILSVDSGANLNPAAGVLIGVPDDFSFAVKWGAIGELLSGDQLTRDPLRAQFAQLLYALGKEAAKNQTGVVQVLVNDVSVFTGSVADLDAYLPSWQDTKGTPQTAAMMGRNLLAFGPSPDVVYGIELDLVVNFPIPASNEYIQVGREHLEGVLGLAQHILSFKQAGAEFADTSPLFKQFLSLAASQNAKLKASALYGQVMTDTIYLNDRQIPRATPITETPNAQ